MAKTLKLKKGLNIRLQGEAEKVLVKSELPKYFALKPTDFIGLTPKLSVKEGDMVKAGDVIFFDKYSPEIKFTAPVSGIINAIVRGDRRRLLEIVIESDNNFSYLEFPKVDIEKSDSDAIKISLLNAGLWPFIKQRPFGTIANPKDTPKSIFISGFDTAPLSPDYDFVLQDSEEFLQTGINALKKLTSGKIHFNVNGTYNTAKTYQNLKGVEVNQIHGPHPAGNVGVQIHHIDPVNKGEVIWTINPQDLAIIGKFFINSHCDFSKIIALSGAEVENRKYYKVIGGCRVDFLLGSNIKNDNSRIISGNVLTGEKIHKNGYLGFYDNQITVIPEGNNFEFLGWAMPGFGKFSNSRAFFSWIMSSKKYNLNTNLNGGHRAFVMTGEYEKVLPMDIYPQYLLKAILAEDFDKMEQLGIYEVIEEDLALCEFVCTSKTDVQQILRDGLNLVKKELS